MRRKTSSKRHNLAVPRATVDLTKSIPAQKNKDLEI